MERRIERWLYGQPDREAAEPVALEARATVPGVVRRLADAGVLNDAAFAANRARSLLQSGRSTRSVQMRLIAKGVAPAIAREASAADPEAELAAALVLARKRRIGPYHAAEEGPAEEGAAVLRMKQMGMLARAGFSRDIAQQALDTSLADAEAMIFELRR